MTARPGVRPLLASWLLSSLLILFPLRRLAAENRVEYRYEDYKEDAGRMHVRTHSVWFEYDLHKAVTARGSVVNDALSGATPTGAPERADGWLEMVEITDRRTAGFVEGSVRLGRTTTTPQVAYSEESDYRSLGVSLTETIDFNQKNTTLTFGVNRNFDEVSRRNWKVYRYKGTWDFLVGVSQILGPRTAASLNLTLGYSDGFLTDPYKGINVYYDLPGDNDVRSDVTNSAESRPTSRFKQVLHGSFSHLFDKVNGSVELSHRLHHDDWGVIANTTQVGWNQRLGKRVVVSPMFRYHHQTAADFYRIRLNTDPSFAGTRVAFDKDNFIWGQEGVDESFQDALNDPNNFTIVSLPALPEHYSADYRLSRMQTFTYGVGVAVKLHEHVSLMLAYKYYEMDGLDGITSEKMYPSAHIFTVGLNGRF